MNNLQDRLDKYNYLELDLILEKSKKDSLIFVKYTYIKNNPKINVLVMYKFPWSKTKYWLMAWKNEIMKIRESGNTISEQFRTFFNHSLWKREMLFWIWTLETTEGIIQELALTNNLEPIDVPNSALTARLNHEAFEIKPGIWCEQVEPTSILINTQSLPYIERKQWTEEALNEVITDWLEVAQESKIKVINI